MVTLVAEKAFDTPEFIASGLLGEVFLFGDIVARTDSIFMLTYSDEAKSMALTLSGTFADYVDDYPTSGSLTSIAFSLDGSPLFNLSGLAMPVDQFSDFIKDGNIYALFQTLLSGADQIDGSAGGDALLGNGGNDVVRGGLGDDQMSGGGGDDSLAGDSGQDTVFFDNLFRSYVVNVTSANGTVSGADSGTDTLTSVERIQFQDGVFEFNADGVAAQVTRLYDTVLQRGPDQVGLDYWVDQIEDFGGTLKQIANGFLNSPEFQDKTGQLSNADYVEFLYLNALGRSSDVSGKNYWVDQLQSGARDRADLLLGFSESQEHRGLTAALVGQGFFNTDDEYQTVALLYDTFAGRMPDAPGLIYWAEALENGTFTLDRIADGFADSPEFRSHTTGMSNTELVNFMYQNTLGRASDAEGLSYWTAQMDAGLDHGGLLLGFSQSYEHFNLLGAQVTNGIDTL